LENFCQQLEPTDTQSARAKQSYEAVGFWLSESDHPFIHCSLIYPQGSASHLTMVKPINGNEHDVDLISLLKGATALTPPAIVKQVIGDRLRANANYADKLEEMPRCWRINYANDFHLDITPSIKNPNCPNGGELVPDKTLSQWKASNPSGFRDLFNKRAALVPASRLRKAMDSVAASAEIIPFPTKSAVKGVLRRTVQLLKRHRDVFFKDLDPAHAPLSIIITTLASKSYEWCVSQDNGGDDFDLLLNTIRMMPVFIESEVLGGQKHWFVWNETTSGENFAEKWNKDPARASAFYHWYKNALHDFEHILEFQGLDAMGTELSKFLDRSTVEKAVASVTSNVSAARSAGTLVTGLTGLSVGTSALATPVKKNTFFGR
jgi:hypothetical protein